jgi:cell division protease FtsH
MSALSRGFGRFVALSNGREILRHIKAGRRPGWQYSGKFLHGLALMPTNMEPDARKRQIMIWYVLAALFGVLLFQQFWSSYSQVETISYSQFETLLDQNKIAEVTVAADSIQGTLKEALPDGKRQFYAVRVDPQVFEKLAAHQVVVNGAATSSVVETILSWVIPVVIFYLVWMFLFRRLAEKQGFGGLMTVGKSRAKVYVETDTKVTFKDVAGVDEAKFELQELVAFLRDPKSYGRLGARVPKGVLLVGPPGTGKTLLAKAVAGEAGVPFFSISGSEFVEMFVGVGAARVRDLFEQARKAAPCIIFIDELDALGRSRVAGPFGGGMDEKEQTLNQLLAELDGFDPSAGVILLAATNRPEILDPALLRAGRFDRQVLVDRPDRKGRLEILRVHVRKVTLAPDVDLDAIAGLTTGFTGADIANLVNEAAIVATRRNGVSISANDFTEAIERIVAGLEKKSRVLNAEERRRVAYHEMGHALVAATLPGVDPVQKISIIPRGVGALGYTIQRPTEDRFLLGKANLENRIAVLMGGRASEQLVFDGDVSTGAADDLQRATEIALEMVTRYGMDDKVGQRTYAPEPQPFMPAPVASHVQAAEVTTREIDVAVRDLLAKAFGRAREILQARRAHLDAGAQLLLKRETLTADDFPPIRSARTGEPRLVELPAAS